MIYRWLPGDALFGLTLSDELSQYSVRVLIGGVAFLTLLLLLASVFHHRFHFTKKAFYSVISIVVLATTLTLLIINIRLIVESEDGAITRLQGKMSIFACGQEISIVPNNGLFSQSAGDSRHRVFPNGDLDFLGYRTDSERDGSLGSFFQAVGGSLSSNVVAIPYSDAVASQVVNSASLERFIKTNPLGQQYLELRSGESCDTTPSMVNVFLYQHNPATQDFTQRKIAQTPEKHILSSKQFGEPDCVVIYFGEPIDKTELTCKGYPDIKDVKVDLLEETTP